MILVGQRRGFCCRRCNHVWLDRQAQQPRHSALPRTGLIGQAAGRARQRQPSLSRQKPRVRRRELASWLALLGATAMLAAALLIWPRQIVSAFPAAARLYQKIGIEVNVVGLAFAQVKTRVIYADGVPNLRVEGLIINTSGVQRKVPELRFTLRDEQGQDIYAWTERVLDEPLPADGRIGFLTEIAAPPEAAHRIEVRFNRIDDAAVAATQ
ncbi:hypothetical protein [Rhodoligotrophos defluvii]|uniref:hypothetical protein n=1 Tax=Rhodoligotrophos defluvii TaxID=2561934 RepID=UPI0010C9958C|nr:hypothetical protein [Rhodoligotrophos defluvii]